MTPDGYPMDHSPPCPTSHAGKMHTWKACLRYVFRGHQVGMLAVLIMSLAGLYLFVGRGTRFFMVPSDSMFPTLHSADMIITFQEKKYRRGDIVVWSEGGEYLVKRIVGLPGDNISVIDGALFINGKYASEPYMKEPMRYYIEYPVQVPEGRFFYLGDNRNQSDDSSLGFIPLNPRQGNRDPMAYLGELSAIVGKVAYIYYPYHRMGKVPAYPLHNTAGE